MAALDLYHRASDHERAEAWALYLEASTADDRAWDLLSATWGPLRAV